ncbi:hypothetical protein MLD38_013963 [Melastoma candidum]|uniref:Uncharacterized protein n=1 Tax=Melastoma candidum TaxID=119954 RepID=A0ACB9RCL7_9MYRT|nr:hypothetical protein MLD38_013963 [Melastoma candidum]
MIEDIYRKIFSTYTESCHRIPSSFLSSNWTDPALEPHVRSCPADTEFTRTATILELKEVVESVSGDMQISWLAFL